MTRHSPKTLTTILKSSHSDWAARLLSELDDVCLTLTALQMLEGSLRDHPLAMLVEPIIANLGCMYELCAPAVSQASKRNLGSWVSRVAPDDFELPWAV